MSSVDASVWVSLFVAQDANHAASESWFNGTVALGVPIVVPAIVLAEVGGAVARVLDHTELAQQMALSMRGVPLIDIVDVDDGLADEAAQIAAEQRIRGADALYVAVAARRNAPLITWDKQQLARAAVVETLTPASALQRM